MLSPRLTRVARRVVLVLVGIFAVLWLYTIVTGGVGPVGQDIDNYWDAATRLRAGQPLYVNTGDPNTWYSYSPWFAWLWVPLTFVPLPVVAVIWMGLCLTAWAYIVWHTRGATELLLLVAPLTLYGAWVGNVQPLMIAALIRWRGPATVGVLASLKVSPILLALVWVGRRRWGPLSIALVVAGILASPAFLYDLKGYPWGLTEPMSPWHYSVLVGMAFTAIASLVAVTISRTRYAWLSAGTAVLAARPSLLLYDVGWLLAAWPSRQDES